MKKQKNDIHVLNWGRIVENCWTEQVNLNGVWAKNKGIQFESVIEKLLLSMFPEEVWKRTKESHDGKRDFVYPADTFLKEQKWAECKNYTSNLSINIISPTLIMGAIDNIKSIYFFSYSPLNDTAIENLLCFSEMEKLDIRVYDGNFLENLICIHHQNGLKEFFPDTNFKEACAILEKTQFRIIRALYDLNGNKIPSTHRFELGESFYIRVIIQNLTMKPLNCIISFCAKNPHVLRCGTPESVMQLSAGEIEKYSILCEAVNPGKTSYTIQLLVNKKIRKMAGQIAVMDEPYLAWSGKNALNAQKEGCQHLMEKDMRPLCIVGESGTGKSTLTEILLQEEPIQKSYKVLKICLTLTRNNCMRSLFSQIFGMYGKELTPKEQKMDDEAVLSLLANNYAESADMIAQTVMKFYNPERPYLFVIDDVQKISRPYISLFQKLDALSYEKNCTIHYLLTLNEEEMSLNELCSLLNWDIAGSKREYKIIKTTKFKREDVLSYMKTRYGLEDIDQYFDDFEKEISPLVLHSFCSGLKNEHVIAQIPEKRNYQVIDPFRFSDGIKQVFLVETMTRKIEVLLNKGGQEEFLLKYLYIVGTFSQEMEAKYNIILQDLIDEGILRDNDGAIAFYHDKIKEEIGKKIKFTEEDYADIFADSNTNAVAKAICALEQIGRLREGTAFLKSFFTLINNIETAEQRYYICKRIFDHMDELNQIGLSSDALQFVKLQFNALRDEQGHKAFYRFLNDIADSALSTTWDIDEQCTETMAYFIKKFFDRALSTYNHQNCLNYFNKYKEIFGSLKHMTNARKNFWLSYYANRVAIALDRESLPLVEEPPVVTELYELSESYSKSADDRDQLILQMAVDNFNRHYVYRHNLSEDNIKAFYETLVNFKKKLPDSMVLDYHLLLSEYLQHLEVIPDLHDFLHRVQNAIQRSDSAFYTLKLYMLEIVTLIHLHSWTEAMKCLSQANEFAYKKEMRSYVYKLTYIKTHLILFEGGDICSIKVYQQAVLTLEQMINAYGNMTQNLKREIFLLVRLMQIITNQKVDSINNIISHYSPDNQKLLHAIYEYVQGKFSEQCDLFNMQSFFVIEGINFPII